MIKMGNWEILYLREELDINILSVMWWLMMLRFLSLRDTNKITALLSLPPGPIVHFFMFQ